MGWLVLGTLLLYLLALGGVDAISSWVEMPFAGESTGVKSWWLNDINTGSVALDLSLWAIRLPFLLVYSVGLLGVALSIATISVLISNIKER